MQAPVQKKQGGAPYNGKYGNGNIGRRQQVQNRVGKLAPITLLYVLKKIREAYKHRHQQNQTNIKAQLKAGIFQLQNPFFFGIAGTSLHVIFGAK